jgi:hypothetical protein
MMRRSWSLALLALSVLGCKQRALTRAEANETLEESKLENQAQALTAGTVEISTNITLGDRVEALAEELRAFYEAELPCAEVTLLGSTLTVEYGVNGTCRYQGQTYSGSHSITVSSIDDGDVVVEHVWDELSNETVRVSGSATVTWRLNAEDPQRRVVHELEWTRLGDGRVGVGSGDRIQRPLEGSVLTGISVNGTRSWQGESGRWDLGINDVEMRWVDAVPRSGSYSLDTPFDKAVSMEFDELDETTIRVTVSSGNRSFDFNVITLPDEDAGE